MPSLREEKRLWKKGFKYVVCLDEAGRGALAGPVVAAAIYVGAEIRNLLKEIKDSKKLLPKKRESLYRVLIHCPYLKWATGRVSEKVIDKINILEATKLAMKRAIRNLAKKLEKNSQKIHDREIFTKFDFLIIDGNFRLDLLIPQKSMVKADERVFSCAAASIIAKVTRDRIMMAYHKKYPKYRFDLHKGYPTELHQKMLKKYGQCAIHRRSFDYGGPQMEKNKRKKKSKEDAYFP